MPDYRGLFARKGSNDAEEEEDDQDNDDDDGDGDGGEGKKEAEEILDRTYKELIKTRREVDQIIPCLFGLYKYKVTRIRNYFYHPVSLVYSKRSHSLFLLDYYFKLQQL